MKGSDPGTVWLVNVSAGGGCAWSTVWGLGWQEDELTDVRVGTDHVSPSKDFDFFSEMGNYEMLSCFLSLKSF